MTNVFAAGKVLESNCIGEDKRALRYSESVDQVLVPDP